MRLTTIEREKITDTMQQIESARMAFDQLDTAKIPHGDEIEKCFEEAEHNLKQALGYAGPSSEEAHSQSKDDGKPS